jgi:hypothetical protein
LRLLWLDQPHEVDSSDDLNKPSLVNKQRKTRIWIWPLRIAASVTLLVAVYYIITPLLQTEDKKIVQSESIKTDEPAEEKKNFIDSIKQDKNLALSET